MKYLFKTSVGRDTIVQSSFYHGEGEAQEGPYAAQEVQGGAQEGQRELEEVREKHRKDNLELGKVRKKLRKGNRKLEKAGVKFKKHTKEMDKDKGSRQEQRSALNMVKLKEGNQARGLDEELGCRAREQQGSTRTLGDKYLTPEHCGQLRATQTLWTSAHDLGLVNM